MQETKHYINLSLVFLAILSIPAIQTLTRLMPENQLNGVVPAKTLPELTWDNWYHFRYQPALNDIVEKEFGFRTSFVRLYNQIDYSVFRQPHGTGVVIGKEDYLFEKWFIDAHYGNDYVGDEQIKATISKLKKLNDYFNHRGKKFAVLISSGKADFYPEYIPNWMISESSITNYEAMVSGMTQAGIPVLDYNRWFLELKDTTDCPLFPKTGTHWSIYGSMIATDSLSGFLSDLLDTPLPDITIYNTSLIDTVKYPDDDLELLMNLTFPMKNHPMCYPGIKSQHADGFHLPAAVVIGDSFFWGLFNIGLPGRIFKDVKFWYYNSTVYPDSYKDTTTTSQLHFPEAFDDKDLILLMCNPSNIQNIGWGFLDRGIQELYIPEWQQEYDIMVEDYIQAIHNTPDWEKQIRNQARESGLPADSLIRVNAKYMADQYLLTHELF